MTRELSDIVSMLERTHATFCETLVTLGETDRLDERPADGGWSAREVSAHQINRERWTRLAAERIVSEPSPELTSAGPADSEIGPMSEVTNHPVSELVSLLEIERDRTLDLLEYCTDADLLRAGKSPAGELTLEACLEALISDEREHARQLTRLLQSARAS